jgi:hypothetical protein
MSKNTDYKIKNVAVSTNGRNEIYFDVEWEGDANLDYYELRVLDANKEYVESCDFAAHNHRIIIKDYILGIKHKECRSETFHIELGIPEYTDEGEQVSWRTLAAYEPISANIYRECNIFHKNVLEIIK